jgi:hypothetical protein
MKKRASPKHAGTPQAELYARMRDTSVDVSQQLGLDAIESLECLVSLAGTWAATLNLSEPAYLQLCALHYRQSRAGVLQSRRKQNAD